MKPQSEKKKSGLISTIQDMFKSSPKNPSTKAETSPAFKAAYDNLKANFKQDYFWKNGLGVQVQKLQIKKTHFRTEKSTIEGFYQ